MTEPLRPDDRELERYLKGDSSVSKRYREASGETAPPELDEIILAQARAEAGRKPPSLNRVMAPLALAASVVIAVNLAWNVRQSEPVPEAPAPPPALAKVELKRHAPAAPEADLAVAKREQKLQRLVAREQERREVAQAAEQTRARQAEPGAVMERESAGASAPPAPQAALADAAPALSETQKIDRLIAHVGALEGAVFIRNGKEYGPPEAAKHLQYKREKAGDRVKTANDFIRLCASHSYLSGEAYLIRLNDGRTRTAEDVLREELARIDG